MGKEPLSPLDMLAHVCSQESDSKGEPTIMKEHLQDLLNGPPPNLINDPIFSPGHPKKKRSELGKKHRLQIKENETMKKKTGKQKKKKKNKKVSMSKAGTFAAQAPESNCITMGEKALLSPLDMLAHVCSIRRAVEYPEVEQESDSKGKPAIMKEHLQDLPNGPPPNLINDPIFSSGHPKKKRSELGKKHRLQIKENEMMKKKTGKQKKKNKKVSKSKASTFAAQAPGPNPPLHIPTALRNLIQRKGGYDVKLIIEKELYDADVNKGQNRFSMPLRQILSENFLNDYEKLLLSATDEQGRNRNDGIVVGFIEPCFDKTTMLLKKRDFTSTSSYVLINNWYRVAVKNKLLKGDTVQAWFFRVKARPWIALVKSPYAQAHYS